MKSAVCHWLAFLLVGLGLVRATPLDVRFSQTLNAEERSASGVTRLSSDHVAVIDALVRRDTTSRAGLTSNDGTPTTFSQRLTADERRTAGLTNLSPEELPKLDAFVERYQGAKLARSLLAPPTYLSRSSRVNPTEAKKEREIHGSFSLSFGWGSGGYSERTGSMVLTMEDPAKRYSITVGYTESHIKGGPMIYRDPLYRDSLYRDPFYDPLRTLPETVSPRP